VRTNRQGSEVKRSLAALDIGSVELSQASVFASPDAEEVLRLLIAIQQPSREALLRGALATAIVGCDAAEIARVSASDSALLGWLERFGAYRDLWHRRGVGVMFRHVLSDLQASARCSPPTTASAGSPT